jgi:hypothetical protein
MRPDQEGIRPCIDETIDHPRADHHGQHEPEPGQQRDHHEQRGDRQLCQAQHGMPRHAVEDAPTEGGTHGLAGCPHQEQPPHLSQGRLRLLSQGQ